MNEFWVCQHCRSLNRAASAKCYSCGKKFGSKPPAVANTGKASKTPPPSPYEPAPRQPPTIASRVSSQSAATETVPGYLSRPAAPANVRTPYLTDSQPSARFSLTRPFERRISAALAVRPSVSVAAIGWISIVSMAALFAIGGLLALTGLPAAGYALQHSDLPGGWNQLTSSQHGMLQMLVAAEVGVGLIALISFSVFVALSTHNTTGLGAETTLLMPGSGFRVWPSLVWFHIRTATALIVPIAVIYYGYELVGLVLAVLVVEVAQRHSDDALDWLDRPAHHLPELHRKLGTEGAAANATIARVWSVAFRVANASAIALYLTPAIALAVAVGLRTSGKDFKFWQESGLGLGQLAIVAVVAIVAVSAAFTLFATIAMVFGIMSRQRTRRTLVRVGRSRPWTAKPGEGTYGAGANGMAGAAGVAGGAGLGAAGLAGGAGYGAGAAAGYGAAGYGAGYGAAAGAASAADAAASGASRASSFLDSLLDDDRVVERRSAGNPQWAGAQPPAPEGSAWPGPTINAENVEPERPAWPEARAGFAPRTPTNYDESDAPPSMGALASPPRPPFRPTPPPPPAPAPAQPAPARPVEPEQPTEPERPPSASAAYFHREESAEGPKPGGLMSRVQSGLAAHAQQDAQHASEQAQENGAPSSGAPSSSAWDIRRDLLSRDGSPDQASLNSPSTTSSSPPPWPSPDESSEE